MTNILDPQKLALESWELIDKTRNICGDASCPISIVMLRDAQFYVGSQSKKGDSVSAKLTVLSICAQLALITKLISLGQRTAKASETGPEIIEHFSPANKDFPALRETVAVMYNVCHGGYMQAVGLAPGSGEAFWEAYTREPPLEASMGSKVTSFIKDAEEKLADLRSKACGA